MSSYHHQNLTDGRLPLWRHGRAWWRCLNWGWSIFHKHDLLLAGIGRRGFCLYLRWFGFYLTWSRRDDFADRGRWEVAWSDGALRLEHPWVRQDGWCRSDPWWKQAIRLPIVDWLIGRDRCETVQGAPVDVFVPLPEGSYRAVATPETRTWRRRWYWPLRRREDVRLDIPGGIPFAGKGENSWDLDDDGLFGCGGDSIEDAIGQAVESVLRYRRRRGHDAHGTGRQPLKVCNPLKEPAPAAGGAA